MKKWRRRCRDSCIPAGICLLAYSFTILPWSFAQRVGSYLGRLAWAICRRDRQRVLEHLEMAFPELSPERRLELARSSYRHLGMTAGELLHLFGRPVADSAKHVHVEGAERVCALHAAGKPIVIISGHCGNWELLAAGCRSQGIPLVAVARDLKNPSLQKLAIEVRGRFGCQVVVRGDRRSIGLLLKTVRGGAVLAMLIDQDTQTDGVFVPFFGRPAYTPVGAAKLAQRLGAAVVPTFVERLEDGSHRVRFEEPLELPEDCRAATAMMSERIEAQIRRRPEQWVWMHRRWRQQEKDHAVQVAAAPAYRATSDGSVSRA